MNRACAIVDQLLESSAKDMVLGMFDPEAIFNDLERLGWEVTKGDRAWSARKNIPFAHGKPVVTVTIDTRPVQNGVKQLAALHFYQDGWKRKGQMIEFYPMPFNLMTAPAVAEQVEAGIRSHSWSPAINHDGDNRRSNIMDALIGINLTR